MAQGCKGLWRMVNPKDVSTGQGQEGNTEAYVIGRIKIVCSSVKACENKIGVDPLKYL